MVPMMPKRQTQFIFERFSERNNLGATVLQLTCMYVTINCAHVQVVACSSVVVGDVLVHRMSLLTVVVEDVLIHRMSLLTVVVEDVLVHRMSFISLVFEITKAVTHKNNATYDITASLTNCNVDYSTHTMYMHQLSVSSWHFSYSEGDASDVGGGDGGMAQSPNSLTRSFCRECCRASSSAPASSWRPSVAASPAASSSPTRARRSTCR